MKRTKKKHPSTQDKGKSKQVRSPKEVKKKVQEVFSNLKSEGLVFFESGPLIIPNWGPVILPPHFGYQPKFPGPVYMPTGIFSAITPYPHQAGTPPHLESHPLMESPKEESPKVASLALKEEELLTPKRKRTVSAPPLLQ